PRMKDMLKKCRDAVTPDLITLEIKELRVSRRRHGAVTACGRRDGAGRPFVPRPAAEPTGRPGTPEVLMPLHPDLYRRLEQRFGKVIIVNEGEEMDSTVYTDPSVLDRRGRPVRRLDVEHRGETYRISCPMCSDTRQRLYINYMFGYRDEEFGFDHIALCHCFN